MNQYRRKMDELRASESLRLQTLQAIRQAQVEEEEEKPPKHPKRIWIPLATMAAAACLVLIISFSGGRVVAPEIVYHTVPATVIRIPPHAAQDSLSLEEYNAYLGLDISSLVGNAELIKSEITVQYEGEIIRDEEGTFYYNVEGAPVMLRISRTKDVAPQSLEDKAVSKIGDRNVVAGVSEDGTERMAAFEIAGINWFLLTHEMEQKDFESLLFGMLETLERTE